MLPVLLLLLAAPAVFSLEIRTSIEDKPTVPPPDPDPIPTVDKIDIFDHNSTVCGYPGLPDCEDVFPGGCPHCAEGEVCRIINKQLICVDPDSCINRIDGKVYPLGVEHGHLLDPIEHPCIVSCICEAGQIYASCEIYAIHCYEPPCPKSQRVVPDDGCCPVCGCINQIDGNTYPLGEHGHLIDPIEHPCIASCRCEPGKWFAVCAIYAVFCIEPPCPKSQRIIKDSAGCCPVCRGF